MASSLFGSKPSPTRPNNAPGGMQNSMTEMIRQFAAFKRQMQGKDPKAMVEEMLRNGQMTQEQYMQLASMADGLKGILK